MGPFDRRWCTGHLPRTKVLTLGVPERRAGGIYRSGGGGGELGSGASPILVQDMWPHLRHGDDGGRRSKASAGVGPPTANTLYVIVRPQPSHWKTPAF
jgi:hypothetical protein